MIVWEADRVIGGYWRGVERFLPAMGEGGGELVPALGHRIIGVCYSVTVEKNSGVYNFGCEKVCTDGAFVGNNRT